MSSWADAVRDAFALQRTLGADQIAHPGGTLFAHLQRVHALTIEWKASMRTQLAAISHATYGSAGFDQGLLSITNRDSLQHAIGHEAEALVYLYATCDREQTYPKLGWRPLPIVDRFTGIGKAIHDTELHDFAVLTIANELDIARNARLPQASVNAIRHIITGLANYTPREAAQALADDALT